jgi:hypothetical protein
MRFRKKPVVIEAIQWTKDNGDEVITWANNVSIGNGTSLQYMYDSALGHSLHIHTLEGLMNVTSGDWIICGVKGEFYPCKPDIFKMTYEPVEG